MHSSTTMRPRGSNSSGSADTAGEAFVPTALMIVRVAIRSPFERCTSFGVAPTTLVSSMSSTPSFCACFVPYAISFGKALSFRSSLPVP